MVQGVQKRQCSFGVQNTRAGMLGCCGSLQHSRHTLPQQQLTADKLQVKRGQWVPPKLKHQHVSTFSHKYYIHGCYVYD